MVPLPADLAYFSPAPQLPSLPPPLSCPYGLYEACTLVESLSCGSCSRGGLVSGSEEEEGTRDREGKKEGREEGTEGGSCMQQIHSVKQGDLKRNRSKLLILPDWHLNAAESCCLVTARWEGNRKWGEMCRGDQQERQEVSVLWGEPQRKLGCSTVLICFLALRKRETDSEN